MLAKARLRPGGQAAFTILGGLNPRGMGAPPKNYLTSKAVPPAPGVVWRYQQSEIPIAPMSKRILRERFMIKSCSMVGVASFNATSDYLQPQPPD